jgi:N-acetylated-alpha-linked acidic dipeptidase
LKNEHIIPSIPAIPLGYGDVYRIISQMGGKAVPKEWQGGLNVTYNFGPGLVNNQKLEIEVHSTIEKRGLQKECLWKFFLLSEIQNVIGYLKGSKEADRYVILSNHFDAWAYGSVGLISLAHKI